MRIVTPDPVLKAARQRLSDAYGDRLAEVVLFGSRARGDASTESDYDVAVFLNNYDLTMPEVLRLADLSWELQAQFDAIVSFKPFPAGGGGSPLLAEVRADGVRV